MSERNGKVCCNCCHCIRSRDEETPYTVCYCEILDNYLSYAEVMSGWCRKWAKEKEKEKE